MPLDLRILNRLLIALCALFLSTPLAAQSGAQEQAPVSLEEQLALWLEWFPGRYDSFAQTDLQAQAGLPEEERNYRRHSVFRRVDVPALGEITFYAEQRRWLDSAPFDGEIYRQRIYAISLDEARQAIRLRVHVPRDQQALLGAHAHPDRLADLAREDMVVWPGCDLFWTYEHGQFIGRLDEGACLFQSPAYGQEVQLEEYLLLDPGEMHFADRGLSLDGEYLFGMRGDTPTIAMRARAFLCDVRDSARLGERSAIPVHDQGGVVLLDAPRDDGTAPMRMRLSVGADALRLDLLAAGEAGEPLARASSDAAADWIGLELGGIAVQCRHHPDTSFEF